MGEIIDMQDFRRKKAWSKFKTISDTASVIDTTSGMTSAQQAKLYESMTRHPAGKGRHE